MEEGPPICDHSIERSDGSRPASGGSAPNAHQTCSNPRQSWRARAKAAKASVGNPKILGVVGAILLIVSIALIAIGAALPGIRYGDGVWTPPPYDQRNSEGVPLDALQPPLSGTVNECLVTLGDWQLYSDAASLAEITFLGTEVTNLSPDQVSAAVDSLQPLQVSIYFWVLSSLAHPWTSAFRDAAEVQVSILNVAYIGVKLSFRLDGVYGVPAADEDVERCAESFETGPSAKLLTQLLNSIHNNASALHVVVCDPNGVNGATKILGSRDSNDPREQSSTIAAEGSVGAALVLRRSALWQSRTSLVHQIGHFFGLPHPFPDFETCKYDGDAITDTPLLYRGSTGCELGSQSMPLCDPQIPLEPASWPIYGFMDTTNDTCRQQFTMGQVLRMRSMLSVLRPTLFQASMDLHRADRIPMASAFQSAIASDFLLERQLSLATTQALNDARKTNESSGAARGNKSVKLPSAAIAAAGRLTSSLDHARLATAGNDILSLDRCSCISPDASGAVFWTGELDSAYLISAVRIVHPWEVVQNATTDAAMWTSNNTSSFVMDAVLSVGDSSASPSAPAPEGIIGASANASQNDFANSLFPAPLVEVWVGSSLEYSKNSLCGRIPFTLGALTNTVQCPTTLSGSIVTVRWLHPLAQWPLCLCDVVALSTVTPPLRSAEGPHAPSTVPGAFMNVSGATASQSGTSSAVSSSAASALAPVPRDPSTTVQCSRSASETLPSWSLDFGADPKLIGGLRLALPFHCSGLVESNVTAAAWNTTSLNCGSYAGANDTDATLWLDIYVTDTPLNRNISKAADSLPRPGDAATCASKVKIIPGRVIDVDCGRFIMGRVVTVVAQPPPPLRNMRLSMCEVRLIGGEVLVMANSVATLQLLTVPADLMSRFAAAIDGKPTTCLQVDRSSNSNNSGGALWTLRLKDSYNVVGVGVDYSGAASSSTPIIKLIDDANQTMWSGSPASSIGGNVVHPVGPLSVRSVQISGFSSICEVSLVVVDQMPVSPALLQWGSSMPPNPATLPNPAFGQNATDYYYPTKPMGAWQASMPGVSDASAALIVDGNPNTCSTLTATSMSSTDNNGTLEAGITMRVVRITLRLPEGGVRNIRAVSILPNASFQNVSIGVAPAWSAEEPGAQTPAPKELTTMCGTVSTLDAWTLATVECAEAVTGDSVIISMYAPSHLIGNENVDSVGGVCEVVISSTSVIL